MSFFVSILFNAMSKRFTKIMDLITKIKSFYGTTIRKTSNLSSIFLTYRDQKWRLNSVETLDKRMVMSGGATIDDLPLENIWFHLLLRTFWNRNTYRLRLVVSPLDSKFWTSHGYECSNNIYYLHFPIAIESRGVWPRTSEMIQIKSDGN